MDLYRIIKNEEGYENLEKKLKETQWKANEEIRNKTLLYHAIFNGKFAIAEYLISINYNIFDIGYNYLSILGREGDKKIMKEDSVLFVLTHKNIKYNSIGPNKTAVIFWAIDRDYKKVVIHLIDNEKVSIKTLDNNDSNFLFHAKSEEMIQILVDRGVDPNHKNEREMTVLEHAVKTKSIGCVKKLLECGADYKILTVTENHILSLLLMKKKWNDVLSIIEKYNIDIRSCEEGTNESPLFFAIKICNEDAIKFLVENGADINRTDEQGRSFIYHIMRDIGSYNVENVVLYLVENGAKHTGHHRIDNRCLELFIAARRGYHKVIDWIVEKDPERLNDIIPRKQDNILTHLLQKETISSDATEETSSAIALIYSLIRKGVNVNHVNAEGKTPLMLAVKSCNGVLIEHLILNGAYVNAQTSKGHSVFYKSLLTRNTPIIRLLLSRGADYNIGKSPISRLFKLGLVELMTELISKGLNINGGKEHLFSYRSRFTDFDNIAKLALFEGISADNETLQYCCVPHVSDEIAMLLLDKGVVADKDSTEKVVKYLKVDTIKAFLEAGAKEHLTFEFVYDLDSTKKFEFIIKGGYFDIDTQNEEGDTLLHRSAMRWDQKLTRILIENGANLFIRNTRLRTPMYHLVRQRECLPLRVRVENYNNVVIETASKKQKTLQVLCGDAVRRNNDLDFKNIPTYIMEAYHRQLLDTHNLFYDQAESVTIEDDGFLLFNSKKRPMRYD